MKILQLVHSRNFAGTERSVLTLSRALAAAGCEVVVATKDKGILQDLYRQNGLQIADIPLNAFFIKHRLANWARQNRIDIIHSHLTEAARIACHIHQHTQIPLAVHLRILRDSPVYHTAARLGLLIANSSHTAHYYNQLGIPPDRIRTIPNATASIDDPVGNTPKHELAAKYRDEFNLPPDARLISFPGRICPGKGHGTLLRAMPAILEKHPSTHILISGNLAQKPACLRQLLALGRQLRIESSIHFLGFRPDVLAITRASEIQIIPSEREPFGLVVIEAMSMETPVIGADSGAIPDILERGTLGTLFPYDDDKALAQTINAALSNPAPLQAKAALAKTRALENYAPSTLASRVISVYEELLGHSLTA